MISREYGESAKKGKYETQNPMETYNTWPERVDRRHPKSLNFFWHLLFTDSVRDRDYYIKLRPDFSVRFHRRVSYY